MIDSSLLDEIQQKLDQMIELAEEENVERPRHSEITLFEDGDYQIDLVHGEPQDKIVDGFEILIKHRLRYRKFRDKLTYQKIRQTEPPAEEIIREESSIKIS